MMTTRSLAIAVVSVLVSSHYLAAQQSSQTSDRNDTDLILGPTARTLKQGQVSIDLPVMVGGPLAEVGLTNRLSIGAGTPVLIPGIRPGSAFLITSKARVFSGQKTDASVGVMHASMAGEGSSGLGYAVVTHGTNDAAVTGGVGFTYSGEGRNHRTLVGMLNGEKRVSKGYKVLQAFVELLAQLKTLLEHPGLRGQEQRDHLLVIVGVDDDYKRVTVGAAGMAHGFL